MSYPLIHRTYPQVLISARIALAILALCFFFAPHNASALVFGSQPDASVPNITNNSPWLLASFLSSATGSIRSMQLSFTATTTATGDMDLILHTGTHYFHPNGGAGIAASSTLGVGVHTFSFLNCYDASNATTYPDGCPIGAGDFVLVEAVNATNVPPFYEDGDAGLNPYYVVSDDYANYEDSITYVTHVSTLSPGGNATTSSPVVLHATGYISAADVSSGTHVLMRLMSLQSFTPFEQGTLVGDVFSYDATTSGAFSLYATSTLPDGNYTIQIDLKKTFSLWDIFTPFGMTETPQETILRHRTNYFIVGNTGTFMGNAMTQLHAIFTGQNGLFSTTTATTSPESACTVSYSVNVGLCVSYLFGWDSAGMGGAFNTLHDGLFARVPFGYVQRFVFIMGGTASTSFPAISYTAGSSSPAVLQGLTYSIQLFDHFDVVNTIRADDGSNKNIWDIIDPYFTVLVSFAVLFVILGDLIGVEIGSEPESDFSDRQKYQIEGMKQSQRTEYPFGRGRVSYDSKGRNKQ